MSTWLDIYREGYCDALSGKAPHGGSRTSQDVPPISKEKGSTSTLDTKPGVTYPPYQSTQRFDYHRGYEDGKALHNGLRNCSDAYRDGYRVGLEGKPLDWHTCPRCGRIYPCDADCEFSTTPELICVECDFADPLGGKSNDIQK